MTVTLLDDLVLSSKTTNVQSLRDSLGKIKFSIPG